MPALAEDTSKKARRLPGRFLASTLLGVAVCSIFSRRSAEVPAGMGAFQRMISSFPFELQTAKAEEHEVQIDQRQLQRRPSVFSFLGRGDTKNIEAAHESVTGTTTPPGSAAVTDSVQSGAVSSLSEAVEDSPRKTGQEVGLSEAADMSRHDDEGAESNDFGKDAGERKTGLAGEVTQGTGGAADSESRQSDSSPWTASDGLQVEAGQLNDTMVPADELNLSPKNGDAGANTETSESEKAVGEDLEAEEARQPTGEGEGGYAEGQDEVPVQTELPQSQQENSGASERELDENEPALAPGSAVTSPQTRREATDEAEEPYTHEESPYPTTPESSDNGQRNENAFSAAVTATKGAGTSHTFDTDTDDGMVLSERDAIEDEVTWEIMPDASSTNQDDVSREQPDIEVISLDSTGISPHLEPTDNLPGHILSVADGEKIPSPRETAELTETTGTETDEMRLSKEDLSDRDEKQSSVSAADAVGATGLEEADRDNGNPVPELRTHDESATQGSVTPAAEETVDAEEEFDSFTQVKDGRDGHRGTAQGQFLRSRIDTSGLTSHANSTARLQSEGKDVRAGEPELDDEMDAVHKTGAKIPEQAQSTGERQGAQRQHADAYGTNVATLFPWIPARDVLSLMTAARILELKPLLELSSLNGSSKGTSPPASAEQHDDASRMQQQLQQAAVLAEDYIKKYLPNGADPRSRFQKAWRTLPFRESFRYLPDSEDTLDAYSEEVDLEHQLEDEELDDLVKKIRARLMKLAAFNQAGSPFLSATTAADTAIPGAVTAFLNATSSPGTLPSAVNSLLGSSFLRQFV